LSAVDRVAIRRRSLVACLGCMGALPWAAMAQKRGTIYRIGIVGLSPTSEIEGAQPRSPQTAMFLRAMSQMGYTYGEHYVTLAHGVAGNPLGMEGLVHELVRQRPDVIVATGPALQALKRATSKIPIVMTAALDPVEMGLVPNLVQPGGNLTGLSLQASDVTSKRLQLLKEVAPGPGAVAVVWNQSSMAIGVPLRTRLRRAVGSCPRLRSKTRRSGSARLRGLLRRAAAAFWCLLLRYCSHARRKSPMSSAD